jgi:hypothetical protein
MSACASLGPSGTACELSFMLLLLLLLLPMAALGDICCRRTTVTSRDAAAAAIHQASKAPVSAALIDGAKV